MARTLYLVTFPDKRKFIFEQLASINNDILCIENCLIETYGKRNLKCGKGIFFAQKKLGLKEWRKQFKPGQEKTYRPYVRALKMYNQTAVIATPDGEYTIEKIWKDDPRYHASHIVRQYSKAFGPEVTNEMLR